MELSILKIVPAYTLSSMDEEDAERLLFFFFANLDIEKDKPKRPDVKTINGKQYKQAKRPEWLKSIF